MESLLAGHSQWYDAPAHLFVFGRDGLTGLIEKSGFRIIRLDGNYERTVMRRLLRHARHALICVVSFALLRPLLGARGFEKMREESKWPIGLLLSAVAQK